MKKTDIKELENLDTIPKELRAIAVLSLIDKAMTKANLTWIDILKELKGQSCPVCKSRVRICSNCQNEVSVGTRNCLRCGENLEKIEIEPSLPKEKL
jgi:uncharacterized protein (UPF0212 family)